MSTRQGTRRIDAEVSLKCAGSASCAPHCRASPTPRGRRALSHHRSVKWCRVRKAIPVMGRGHRVHPSHPSFLFQCLWRPVAGRLPSVILGVAPGVDHDAKAFTPSSALENGVSMAWVPEVGDSVSTLGVRGDPGFSGADMLGVLQGIKYPDPRLPSIRLKF